MSRNRKKVAQADVSELLFQKESWGGYSTFRSCPITLEDVTCRSGGVSWPRRKVGLIIRKKRGILCISMKCIRDLILRGLLDFFFFSGLELFWRVAFVIQRTQSVRRYAEEVVTRKNEKLSLSATKQWYASGNVVSIWDSFFPHPLILWPPCFRNFRQGKECICKSPNQSEQSKR